MVALAQQLTALNTKLCSGGTVGTRLTAPVLAQLEAAWTTMCALFRLASALQLQRPDFTEVAQAGSLIFHSGQQALAAGLAAVRSPQAGHKLLVELARRAERQLMSAERFLDFLLCKNDQPADFRFSAGVAAAA